MEWLETGQGIRISKQANIVGLDRIVLEGHSVISAGCQVEANVYMVDGDERRTKAAVSLGRYCVLEKNVRVKPPVVGYKKRTPGSQSSQSTQSTQATQSSQGKMPIHCDMSVRSHVWIGQGCKVYCRTIGSSVIVGAGTQLNRCSEIGSVVLIDSGLIIPERFKIPSYSRVSRHPSMPNSIIIEPISPTFGPMIEQWCKKRYLGAPVDLLGDTQLPTMREDTDMAL